MKAGAAKMAITPPAGIELSGYAGRPGSAAGVHDELYARAVVVEDGHFQVAVLTLDLLGLSSEQVAYIRTIAAAMCPVPPENILIACSHTHAGPAIQRLRGCGTPDPDYVEKLSRLAAQTVALAASNLEDADLYVAHAHSDLAINRRQCTNSGSIVIGDNPAGPTDSEIGIAALIGKNGPIASLFNYACHGVVLGSQNVQISADWIGAAAARIELAIGAPALFLQGCSGNINPRIRGGFEEVEQAGEIVARPVIEALSPMLSAAYDETSGIRATGSAVRSTSRRITLPLQPLPPIEELHEIQRRTKAEVARLESDPNSSKGALDWAKALDEWTGTAIAAHASAPSSVEIEIQAISIGPLKIIALPGEAFVEIALAIKNGDPNIFVTAYANGNIGYIPTKAAFAERGYEVDAAYKLYGLQMIAPESECIIVSAARSVLRDLEAKTTGSA